MLAAGVIGQPEPLTTVRLETENPPDPADREGRQSRGAGHPGPQPVRGPLGRGLQGVDDDPLDLLHPDHRRPGDVDQPVKTMLDEPVAPLTHRGHDIPTPRATSALDAPVEHSSTMRHLSASAWADLRLRAHLMSWPLSSPDNVSSTAAGPLLRPISQEPVKNQK